MVPGPLIEVLGCDPGIQTDMGGTLFPGSTFQGFEQLTAQSPALDRGVHTEVFHLAGVPLPGHGTHADHLFPIKGGIQRAVLFKAEVLVVNVQSQRQTHDPVAQFQRFQVGRGTIMDRFDGNHGFSPFRHDECGSFRRGGKFFPGRRLFLCYNMKPGGMQEGKPGSPHKKTAGRDSLL